MHHCECAVKYSNERGPLTARASGSTKRRARHGACGAMLKKLFPGCADMIEVVRRAGEERDRRAREARVVREGEEARRAVKSVLDGILERVCWGGGSTNVDDVDFTNLEIRREGETRKRASTGTGGRKRHKGGSTLQGPEDEVRECLERIIEEVVVNGEEETAPLFDKLGLEDGEKERFCKKKKRAGATLEKGD